jgi:hypothetical protein
VRVRPVQQSCEALLALGDEGLAETDPLEMNLLLARGVPALAHLDIPSYQETADGWAVGVRQFISRYEEHFRRDPPRWKNDINFFRLGLLCQFVECELGIRYREDQRELKSVLYTDPSDLFLNGVMDTRRGTCGNMAALHVALGWRLNWPVSMACVCGHYICRYDDGRMTHNIEPTQAGQGGFKSDPDDYLVAHWNLPPKAITCGSDLRAVNPRELLGLFVGFRARHNRDSGRLALAERDYLLARYLFPEYRRNSREQMAATARCNVSRFEEDEPGHPANLWALGVEVAGKSGCGYEFHQPLVQMVGHEHIDELFLGVRDAR